MVNLYEFNLQFNVKLLNPSIELNIYCNLFNLDGAFIKLLFEKLLQKLDRPRFFTNITKKLSITIYFALIQMASNFPIPYTNPIDSKMLFI